MQSLPRTATLPELQRYVADMEKQRGFTDRTVLDQCLMLGEEVGELFKAVRKHQQLPIGTTSIVGTVDEELADVLIFVCAVANRYGIDLSEALRRKEQHNEQRTWR
ncbi:NTP pyrophosphatase, house-cleaning of non-canonical NTPs [Micromonospora viridifaciens]|uniref:NTP pyrophosphatase, house-cleaning of non-canonical NTPs n=1 Tax=Micromonospora viridifaciens TaxID=1881 RepID=A0A1C4Y7A3_MICVI|nr:MazG nucleotide pyrophosphohydrolase domain-containing protein [Micromonospora viridifaciens]SCF16608.1 NTP pyrophosphatase, house-cleaning of non-canonical NTPs [Micromonospora viridifaciens]